MDLFSFRRRHDVVDRSYLCPKLRRRSRISSFRTLLFLWQLLLLLLFSLVFQCDGTEDAWSCSRVVVSCCRMRRVRRSIRRNLSQPKSKILSTGTIRGSIGSSSNVHLSRICCVVGSAFNLRFRLLRTFENICF